MTTRVGINGFGRIGRQSLKALIERAPDVEVVAVNDLVDAEMNALLFKHDSTYGAYPGDVDAPATRRSSSTAARSRSSPSKDPATLPWGDLGVDIVLESTGLFTDADEGRGAHRRRREEGHHQRPGQGRGHHDRPRRQRGPLRPGERTTSSATPAARRTAWRPRPRSSTTCRHRARPDEHDPLATPTTSASSTWRTRIRAAPASAGQNIIPTTTGAAKALALVIPDLKGKFDGFSLRVPTPDGQRRRLHRRRQRGRPRSRSSTTRSARPPPAR